MHVIPVNYNQKPYVKNISSNKAYNPCFGVNIYSPKLKFSADDFFVRIRGYGQNKPWAEKVIESTNLGADLLRWGTPPEMVLKLLSVRAKDAAGFILDEDRRFKTGILRYEREDWPCVKRVEVITDYASGKYAVYKKRLSEVYQKPLLRPYDDVSLSVPTALDYIEHGLSTFINSSLNRVFNLSGELFPKYINQDPKQDELDEINSIIAEIRWILAHATPWRRGSDGISNMYMRAMYKALGIKTYPILSGKSLDLEAYCTELKDYKRKFKYYFAKNPEIVED